MNNPDQLFPENPEEATEAWFDREKDRFEARFAGVLMWSSDGMNWHVFTEENPDDLKAIDDLLPPDLVAIIEENRQFLRALYTGIPDAAYRVYH